MDIVLLFQLIFLRIFLRKKELNYREEMDKYIITTVTK
jgi:hypothetical protein